MRALRKMLKVSSRRLYDEEGKMGREIIIYRSENSETKLSTIHSESSFGRPVLVVDGQAYRPSDILPSGLSAHEVVQLFLMGGKPDAGKWSRRTKRAVAMAEKFK